MLPGIILGLLNILFGLAILIFPAFLRLIVGGYFILNGILIFLLL